LVQEQVPGIDGLEHQPDPFGRMKISDAPELGDSPLMNPVVALGVNVNEDRVADWLWTLHRIVVDVVRTDRHLEFYGDAKKHGSDVGYPCCICLGGSHDWLLPRYE